MITLTFNAYFYLWLALCSNLVKTSWLQIKLPVSETWLYLEFAEFSCRNGLGKRLQAVSSFLNLHPLCWSSCRGAYLLVQPWICCPEIGLGNKALKIGGGVTLIISANDTLTVARSTGEWRLYHVQLSRADSVCLALPRAAAFCWWLPPKIWCGNVS